MSKALPASRPTPPLVSPGREAGAAPQIATRLHTCAFANWLVLLIHARVPLPPLPVSSFPLPAASPREAVAVEVQAVPQPYDMYDRDPPVVEVGPALFAGERGVGE